MPSIRSHQEPFRSHALNQEPSGAIMGHQELQESHQEPSGAIRSNALKAHT
jgi:hypothetical protein